MTANRSSLSAISSEVRKGDKRIILIDGEAVGAINRVPGRERGALQHACGRTGREDRHYRS